MDPRRRIPSTHIVLADPRLTEASQRLGETLVKRAVDSALLSARIGELAPEQVVDAAVARLPARATGLAPVVNATGVLVHTNLGRAPLSDAAVDAIVAASGTVDVELDLTTGLRSRRGRGATTALTSAVPSAAAVHIVNNNAAALCLIATALAQGKDIIVSKGELVEIGDGFRLPDLLASTGAQLREVGTTNRTTVTDYEAALHDDTAFILKVHPSNFRIAGFTSEASVSELAELGPPVVVDIGSGLLTHEPLLPDEPDATSTLRAGAALVTASGDKLLGGPQAGLILGSEDLVERLRTHPMARAMRVDKLTLAGLEATLSGPKTPIAQCLHADPEVLRTRAAAIADAVDGAVVETEAVVGGGGAPGLTLPSFAVAIDAAFAQTLRTGNPAVLGRIRDKQLLLDLRTMAPSHDSLVVGAIQRARTACM